MTSDRDEGAVTPPPPLWLPALLDKLDDLTASVVDQVEAWLGANGACLTPEARRRAEDQARAAVVTAIEAMTTMRTFSHPLRARRYAVLSAAGLLFSELREEWRTTSLDDAALDAAGLGEPASAFAMWINSRPEGRPAQPLISALVAFMDGASLGAIADAVRAEGLALDDGQVAVELLRALWEARRRDLRFSAIVAATRSRLATAIEDHPVAQGLALPGGPR